MVTELSPPYQTIENDQVAGSATEKVKQLMQNAELSATFHLYPWARAYSLAKREADTLIYAIAKTEQREDLFHWIMPLVEYNLGFVALSSAKPIRLHSNDDLQHYRIAVQRHDVAHKWLVEQHFEEGKNFIICADIFCSWELLINKKVDLIIDSPDLLTNMLARFELPASSAYYVKAIPELKTIGYLAANKNIAPGILAKLDAAALAIQHK